MAELHSAGKSASVVQTWLLGQCTSRIMAEVLLHLAATKVADSLPIEVAKLVVCLEKKGYC